MSVRYFKNDGNNETQTKFLGLIEIGESSEGEILYQKVNKFLFSGPNTHKQGLKYRVFSAQMRNCF